MIPDFIPPIVLALLDAQGIAPSVIESYEVDATKDPIAIRLRLKPNIEVVEIEIVKDV